MVAMTYSLPLVAHFCQTATSFNTLTTAQGIQEHGIIDFLKQLACEHIATGHHARARKCKVLAAALNRHGLDNFAIGGIDREFLKKFETWLRERGMCWNTVSFYMRTLRACLNIAAARGMIGSCPSFREVYTGIDKTRKRAIGAETLHAIAHLNLDDEPQLRLARDIFMLSFYTRGMSFIDMGFLKKTDIVNGYLCYKRRKTGQALTIKWERCMQSIIDRLPTAPESPYLLPFLRADIDEIDARRICDNALHCINRHLKLIGSRLNLPYPLTSYVARHSWGSIARSLNIPIPLISAAMGHESEKTTRIYLSTIDNSAIDDANLKVIVELSQTQSKIFGKRQIISKKQ